MMKKEWMGGDGKGTNSLVKVGYSDSKASAAVDMWITLRYSNRDNEGIPCNVTHIPTGQRRRRDDLVVDNNLPI